MTNGISTSSIKSTEDIWTGNTQYKPVYVRFKKCQDGCEGRWIRHVSVKDWRDEETTRGISDIYNEKLPQLIEKTKQCNNSNKLQDTYRQIEMAWGSPWKTKRGIPTRYKSFWNLELDRMATWRKALYRTARNGKRNDAWDRYHECRHKIRMLVRKRK